MPRHAAHVRLKLRGKTYQARFTRKGREHRWSTGEGDKSRAQQEAERLVLEHDAGGPCKVCRPRAEVGAAILEQLSERWMKALLRTHPEVYRKRAATDMSQYIEQRWADPREITSKAWEEAKIHWHTTPSERRERLTWGTIANLANTLRAFLHWCCEGGVIDSEPKIRNPSAKQLAADRAYVRPMDEAEQDAFLWALAIQGEARALRVYIVLFETWMRKSAPIAMTRRWLNFDRQRIKVPNAYTKAQLGDREIDLTPKAEAAIRWEMQERWGDGPIPLDEPIFGKYDFRTLFEKTIALAGIDPKGLTAHHVTRRTAATLGGAKPGASLSGMMAQGGWIDPKTVGVYMKPSVEAARKITR